VFNAWFYLTPIVYPLGWVPEGFRRWIELNPLTPLVELYRQALLGSELALAPGVGWLAAFAAGVLALGWWVFDRMEPAFVDEI
jgi:lipopolysaccharide transport system permease protein